MAELKLPTTRDEPLRWLGCKAYHAVRPHIPASVADTPLAFCLGALSGHAVAAMGGSLSSAVADERTVDLLAAAGLGLAGGKTLNDYLINPPEARFARQAHPVYHAGTYGVMLGAPLRGIQELVG